MSRRSALSVLCAPVFALLALASRADARDPTIGLCTRKDDLAKALEALDPLVQELTAAPDEAKRAEIGARIAKEHGSSERIEALIRYREPAMRHVLLPLLEEPLWAIRQRALFGLSRVGDASAVPAVAKALSDPDARIRETAANCLCRIASAAPPELAQALEKETDRFARSSLEAAAAVLSAEAKPWGEWKETLAGPEGARRVEWVWAIKGPSSFSRYDAKTLEYPRADTFDWPISWYEGCLFSPVPRNSFGANGTHCGEDMAWFREGASLYAAANGLVRLVQGAGGDWGFLVAIEHHMTGGLYLTTIYGHMGPDVLVKPGDVVKKGQRIGTVGFSCSVENGGYGSHCHFGISDGPFRRPKGLLRGMNINLNFAEEKKTVQAPVIALVYDPSKTDEHGFPGLGLVVKFPDGNQRVLPAQKPGTVQDQVSWLQGYVKNCAGWFNPQPFVEGVNKKAAEAAQDPGKKEGEGQGGAEKKE